MIPPTLEKKSTPDLKEEDSVSPSREKKFKSVYDNCSIDKEVHEETLKENNIAITPLDLARPPLSPLVIAISPINSLKEVETLFVQMVETMTTLYQEGHTETTFVLNRGNDSFLSGTEITILEYNTAPKDFNIQIKGSPEAVKLFERHLGGLVAAFNAEHHHPFKIHRLEIYQNSKRATVRKKEATSEEKECSQDEGSTLSLD